MSTRRSGRRVATTCLWVPEAKTETDANPPQENFLQLRKHIQDCLAKSFCTDSELTLRTSKATHQEQILEGVIVNVLPQ